LPASEKRCYRTSAFTGDWTASLHHVYVLADGKPAVAHLTPGEALPELVRHSCGIRAIWHIGLQTRHFNQVTALLSAIDVRRLYRPRDLTSLDAVVRMVEEDVDHGRSNRLSGALSPRV
jgi:hypothetical protein